ncbi:YybH family protein [Massilia sp. GCM10020059]|uniref:SgcJ/EcaC family oxidoreductase n=1 Tax=Massilia agrisoli TaxID=2892444 RepID=A0ABS8INA2_9BURK|nr:SgcJ/EcaC family oxidoreductase [Massilia agrisoli]MCC6069810.1 SgcJ/EcaC family oxidoreductase [Massilia agrisoli]
MSQDEQEIRQLVETWLMATQAGDVEAVLALMSDDVMFMSAGQPPMTGREAFARGLNKVLAENVIESTSEIAEIVVSGDLAYCRTKLTVTITSKHGQLPILRNGDTLSILRKQADGKWRLTRDANMLAAAA